MDYDETFSPVVRSESVRAVIALAAQNTSDDVTTAFLNGELKEVVYMKRPDGYIKKGKISLQAEAKHLWSQTVSALLDNHHICTESILQQKFRGEASEDHN